MPKTKTHSGAKKQFKLSSTGKVLRRRRHRTTPPGHVVKSSPGKRKRGRQDTLVVPSDEKTIKKMLGRG